MTQTLALKQAGPVQAGGDGEKGFGLDREEKEARPQRAGPIRRHGLGQSVVGCRIVLVELVIAQGLAQRIVWAEAAFLFD